MTSLGMRHGPALLCRMEQGEVKNYTETEKLDRIRQANAQRHVSNTSDEVSNFQKKAKNKVLICSYYNQGTCMHQKSHDTKGVTYRHICAYSFQQTGKTYPHAEQNCRNKTKKNDKKRVKEGGFEPAPTRKFATKSYFNTELSYSRLESDVSKDQAVRWFKQATAFQKIQANKSYAQALVSNATVYSFAYPRAGRNLGVTDKSQLGTVGNNQCYRSASTVASAQKITHVKLPRKNQSQPPGERVAIKTSNRTKNSSYNFA